MVATNTPRLQLAQYSAAGDTWPGRTGWNTLAQLLEGQVAEYSQGTQAARPAAGNIGRAYWAADTRRLWWDDGTIWTEVSPVGGGGVPAAALLGAAGAEGNSRVAARADHTHPMAAPPAPTAMNYNTGAVTGVSTAAARADHRHAFPALPPNTVKFAGGHSIERLDNSPLVIAPGGFWVIWDWTVDLPAGAMTLDGFVQLQSGGFGAGYLETYMDSVVQDSARFHNREQPGLHVIPFKIARTIPEAASHLFQVGFRSDPLSSGNFAAWNSHGYLAVL